MIPPADQTIRGAISTDTTLEQAEYDTSSSSDTQEITIPTWTMGSRYVFLGVPEAEADISDIDQNGISEFSDWQRVPGVMFERTSGGGRPISSTSSAPAEPTTLLSRADIL